MEVTPDEPIAKLHDGADDPGMSDDPQLGLCPIFHLCCCDTCSLA